MQKSNSALVISLSIVISVIVIVVVLTTTLLLLPKDSTSEKPNKQNAPKGVSTLKHESLKYEDNMSENMDSDIASNATTMKKAVNFESEEIGAIFYCYKNKKATEHVLKRFRTFYPKGDIALLADGGLDFRYLKPLIPLTYYEYSKNLSIIWKTPSLALEWFDRFHRGMHAIQNRWVVTLEDDVEFRSRFKTVSKATMSGGRVYITFLSPKLSRFLRDRRQKLGIEKENSVHKFEKGVLLYGYGGCGGCVIDRKWWMEHYDSKEVSKLLKSMIKLEPQPDKDPKFSHKNILHLDIVLSSIILYFGGTLQAHPEWAQDYVEKPIEEYAVFHNWKENYSEDLLLNKYELK